MERSLTMKKLSRRSFLHHSLRGGTVGMPTGVPAVGGAPGVAAIEGTSRRAFLQGTAGAAAGAAVILATPKVASIALDGSSPGAANDPKAVVTKPSGPAPPEPVTAYVRDPHRGEVTVMSGTRETTYRDPVLVKRLLDAAH
jgi:hypothetical protein